MHWLFRVLTERLKALFVANVASDLEAQLLSRDAERQAELLRQAQRYEDEGFPKLSQQMRQQAEAITFQQPLASVLPAIDHWQTTDTESLKSLAAPVQAPMALGSPKKKGR